MFEVVTSKQSVHYGKTLTEVAEKLRKECWIPTPNLTAYMAQVADRARQYNGTKVRTDTVTNWFDDLVEGGFLMLIIQRANKPVLTETEVL